MWAPTVAGNGIARDTGWGALVRVYLFEI